MPAETLEPRHHVITVRATDSEGAVTESSVAIDVTVHRVHPMRIVALADAVEVWWPADTAGLRLEAAEEFDGDGWYPVDAEPELDGDWFHARLPVGDEPLFFRLSDPSTP